VRELTFLTLGGLKPRVVISILFRLPLVDGQYAGELEAVESDLFLNLMIYISELLSHSMVYILLVTALK